MSQKENLKESLDYYRKNLTGRPDYILIKAVPLLAKIEEYAIIEDEISKDLQSILEELYDLERTCDDCHETIDRLKFSLVKKSQHTLLKTDEVQEFYEFGRHFIYCKKCLKK